MRDEIEELIVNKLGEHDARFDAVDARFERIETKLLEHDDRLERIEQTMATKNDVREIIGMLEPVVALAKRLEDERTVQAHRTKRLEDNDARQDEDIRLIKQELKLA